MAGTKAQRKSPADLGWANSNNRSQQNVEEVQIFVKEVVDMLIEERAWRIDFQNIANDLETFSQKGT